MLTQDNISDMFLKNLSGNRMETTTTRSSRKREQAPFEQRKLSEQVRRIVVNANKLHLRH